LGLNEGTDHGHAEPHSRSSPVQLPGTVQWKIFKTESQMSAGIRLDGTLWTWGANSYGQNGRNQSPSAKSSSPTQVGTDTTWKNIALGYEGCVKAIKTDGTLWSWGYNANGQLGLNTQGPGASTAKSSPTQVPGTNWSTVSCDNQGVMATKTDGTLWMWGKNEKGNLGQNNLTNYSSPVQIPGTTWTKGTVASYANGSAALKTDGTLWTWGRNHFGQLGQNNQVDYSSPVQLPGTWTDVRMGYQTSAGVKSGNTLWMWGDNDQGQSGQNNLTQYSSPVQIPGAWTLGSDSQSWSGYMATTVALKII